MTTQKNWYIYLIREKNNRLYCGITTGIQRRFTQHQEGKGAKALKGKMPLTLVFHCLVGDRSAASKLEFQVKKLSKKAKERLILDQPDNIINYLVNHSASK
ncbi:GIY-YIG nuclease family protein [Providencia sp. PROV139]|uniref:GIY-YIG nuclease family protein n=1 Tax=Providencia sp. PROV139 TaxID=2949849 RepID=UPI00234A71FF|nr:GIY-YIG nuclease family protein [Providencia sp. PROV139]